MPRGHALTRIVEKPFDSGRIDALVAAGVPRLPARVLSVRGIDAEGLDAFLRPSLADLARPEDLPGVADAADAVLAAITENRKIVVFGDYDCDGVCATAVMIRTLEALGARVAAFIPRRLDEGYGMNEASIARLLREQPDVGLVLTVDNGVNAVNHVADLAARGIRVVVTDHHLPSVRFLPDGSTVTDLPAAAAIIDPKVAAPAHLEGLCGAGVAFFLSARLVAEAKRRGLYDGVKVAGPLLVLAALATVTDIMPLTGQNRIVVAEALRRFDACAPIGLRKLFIRAAKTGCVRYTARDFGFLLGPRVNAVGRLGDSMRALDLLLCADPDAAENLAVTVDECNLQRKEIEQRMTDLAMEQVVPGASAQVIGLQDDNPQAAGVAGIVAARVLEKLRDDPAAATLAVCISVNGRGSARSVSSVNIRDALAAAGDSLERFGGHAAAAGFSVREGALAQLREALCRYCDNVRATLPEAGDVCAVDAVVEPDDLTLEVAEWLQKLEPFGEGNEEPRFAVRGVRFASVQPLGVAGNHLMITFADWRLPRAVWWRHGGEVERLRAASASRFDVAFTLAISDYGERHAELRVLALAPTLGS